MKFDCKRMNVDIFDNIIPFLDTLSIQRFLLTSKSVYFMLFKSQESYMKKKITSNILKELDLSNIIVTEDTQLLLSMIYKHFYYHLNSYIIDYVIFLIEKNVKNKDLIYQLLDLCRQQERKTPKFNRYEISYSDIQYMLIHAKLDVSSYILNNYYISPEILFIVFQEFVPSNRHNEEKIRLLVNYFMYKHIFRNMNQDVAMFFQLILGIFIKNKLTFAIEFVIKNKAKYNVREIFDYRYLYNTCIAEDNMEILTLIHTHNTTQTPILIEHSSIKSLFQKGRLTCLKFVLDTLLGKHINLPLYINAICAGITANPPEEKMRVLKYYLNETNINIIEAIFKKT